MGRLRILCRETTLPVSDGDGRKELSESEVREKWPLLLWTAKILWSTRSNLSMDPFPSWREIGTPTIVIFHPQLILKLQSLYRTSRAGDSSEGSKTSSWNEWLMWTMISSRSNSLIGLSLKSSTELQQTWPNKHWANWNFGENLLLSSFLFESLNLLPCFNQPLTGLDFHLTFYSRGQWKNLI